MQTQAGAPGMIAWTDSTSKSVEHFRGYLFCLISVFTDSSALFVNAARRRAPAPTRAARRAGSPGERKRSLFTLRDTMRANQREEDETDGKIDLSKKFVIEYRQLISISPKSVRRLAQKKHFPD